MSYRLLEEFKDYDMDFLIPSEENLDKYLNNVDTNYDDGYEEGFRLISGSDIENDHDNIAESFFGISKKRDTDDEITLEDLVSIFNFDMDYADNEVEFYETFLDNSVADLLGITPSQLKFINLDYLYDQDHTIRFINNMVSGYIKDKLPDVQKRIYFSLNQSIFNEEEDIDMIPIDDVIRIINTKGYDKCSAILRRYRDYIRMYNEVNSYLSRDKALSDEDQMKVSSVLEQFHKLNKYGLKPSQIKDHHDKMVRLLRTVRSIYDTKDIAFYNENMKKMTNTTVYNKFLDVGTTYGVYRIPDYDSLVNEGEVLNHCVAEYIDDILLGKSMIYGIRYNAKPNDPFFTLELVHDSSNKSIYRMTQCFGINDTIDKPAELQEYIIEWADKHGIKIWCDI